MKLYFFGGTKVVSGVNYLLQQGGEKILIDCGMFQGAPEFEEKNYKPFPYNPKEIKALLVTHSHIDHIGLIPKLVQEGFSGPIYATPPTIDLSLLMLKDAAQLENWQNGYTKENLDRVSKLFKPVDYYNKIKISPNFSFRFLDAGHILGSAIIEIYTFSSKSNDGKIKIVFSGDIGNIPNPLLKDTDIVKTTDYLLVEAAYGDRIHEGLKKRKDILEDTIEETIAQRGTILIPSFALERTQEILFEINELVENSRIPRIPVFIDSPLTIDAIDVYKKYKKYFNRHTQNLIDKGDEIFYFPGIKFTKTVKESKNIKRVPPPKMIIAGSGMSTGGRILFHEKLYLGDHKNCLIFICYQAEGTLGRKILDGEKTIEIFGETLQVRARIVNIQGYSAHADQKGILRWVSSIQKPIKKIFLVQGEEKSIKTLSQIIKDNLGFEVEVPEYGQVVEI